MLNDKELIGRLQSALGTAETGEALIQVARDAARGEQDAAAIRRRMESFLLRGNGRFVIVSAPNAYVGQDVARFACKSHAEVYAVLNGIKDYTIAPYKRPTGR